MTRNVEPNRQTVTALDEARAAALLAHISASGTSLDAAWYGKLASQGLDRADVDRALNLLAERIQILLAVVYGRLFAVLLPTTGGIQ